MTPGTSVRQRKVTYPLWNTEPPELPARSPLSKLEPIGIGTREVESLTSYLARLGTEHCTSPRRLLLHEVLAPIGKGTYHYSSSPAFSASQLNGVQGITDVVTSAFERLTMREDLRHMTLFNWGDVLSSNQLLRSKKAWCATCYEDWLGGGENIYDPLIWAIEVITICPKHNERLYEACPNCKRRLPFLSKHYLPGYCSSCQTWLGATNKAYLDRPTFRIIDQTELTQQAQIALTVKELLSYSPKIKSRLTSEYFIANLANLIDKEASRSINLFADLIGIWSGSIRRLLVWQTRLRLEVLCKLCRRLNVSPLDLLLDRDKDAAFRERHLLLRRDIPVPNKVAPWEEVEGELYLALKENPPPSMEVVARRMGYSPPKVKRHYPQLCAEIINRYWEYERSKHPPPQEIKKALRAALKENPPPSLQRVFRRLGCKNTGYYYYTNYYPLCCAVIERFKEYRNKPFDRTRDRGRMIAALNEEPPPSFSEVARRLGHKRDFVRAKFPELSKAVTSKYLHYTKVLRKEKAERLRYAIREAIKQLVALGLNTSEARVKNLVKQSLPNLGRDILFKQALREVKAKFELT